MARRGAQGVFAANRGHARRELLEKIPSWDPVVTCVAISGDSKHMEDGLVWSTPKSWERRSVPFPAVLAAELSALMVGKAREDLVFASQRGYVLRVSNYRKRFFAAAVEKCKAADETFPTITPHDLRHTAASLAVSAGANVKAIQRMLGHAKASMTLDVYADLFDDDLDGVAASLDAAIKSTADALRTTPAQ